MRHSVCKRCGRGKPLPYERIDNKEADRFAEGGKLLPYERIDKKTVEFELIRLSFFNESSPICGIYLTVMVDAGVDPTKRSCRVTVGKGLVPFRLPEMRKGTSPFPTIESMKKNE